MRQLELGLIDHLPMMSAVCSAFRSMDSTCRQIYPTVPTVEKPLLGIDMKLRSQWPAIGILATY
jgi:hypothetical protein